jgi:hypothetical protein
MASLFEKLKAMVSLPRPEPATLPPPENPPIPADSVDPEGAFRYIGKSQLDLYQRYMNRLFTALDIEKMHAGYQWAEQDGDTIFSITEKAHQKHGLLFLYFQTMLEQYLDADSLLRQLHRNCWVRTVTRCEKPIELTMFSDNFFPEALPIMLNVKKRFF